MDLNLKEAGRGTFRALNIYLKKEDIKLII